jgi:hypothetical protein
MTNRSNYDLGQSPEDVWGYVRYRGAVKSSISGRRGQEFLKELLKTIETLPKKELAVGAFLDSDGCACALGALALKRGHNPDELAGCHYMEPERLAVFFGVATALVREIMFENDAALELFADRDRRRTWLRIHNWLNRNIKK